VFPGGLYATVRGDRFKLTVGPNAFTFRLADLAGGRLQTLENGNIEIESVPTQVRLSEGAGEADFPALAAGPDGRIAVVWQELRDGRDRLLTREFDGKSWAAPEVLETAETSDVFRSAAAYAGGDLHLVWSAQVNGNWDLYGRRKTAAGWQAAERLTEAAGPDFHHKLIAAGGELWLAWQAFRGGQSDIFLRSFAGGKWSAETRVTAAPRQGRFGQSRGPRAWRRTPLSHSTGRTARGLHSTKPKPTGARTTDTCSRIAAIPCTRPGACAWCGWRATG
jgi:hypothetical protein